MILRNAARLILTIVAVGFGARSHAQEAAGNNQSGFCWRGRPLPRCEAFLLTEISVYKNLATPSRTVNVSLGGNSPTGPQTYGVDKRTLSLELGPMYNVRKQSAIGMTVLFDIRDDAETFSAKTLPTFGLKTRYRYWIKQGDIALDAGVGVRTHRDELPDVERLPFLTPRAPVSAAFVGDVAINAADLAALTARIDVARFDKRLEPRIAVGVRAGSYPATAITVTLLTIVGTLLILFSGEDW